MPPRHSPLELDRLFSYRISVLSNRLALGASRLYGRRFGLVLREWRVLALLGQFAPMSARDIIERSALDKASVSRAVASLAERSLVRTRRDANDSRLQWLELTAKGQRLYSQVAPIALERQRALLSALTPEERSTLDRLLGKLTEQIGRLDTAAR